jgi:NAD(P)-dependent dehydrogenase (short-subunit alcohol dehydrogenase family)
MAGSLDFRGQIAVVTGAGRGLGRAYAEGLAAGGATVVVNDLGVQMTGDRPDPGIAEQAAEAIRAAGGDALADAHDVATPDGGAALVERTLQEFGRVDILISNAGSGKRGRFDRVALSDVVNVVSSHLLASFYTGQPAWRAMLDQGYGRVLTTTSAAMFGAPNLNPYPAAVAAHLGLVATLALEAAESSADLKVNCIAPTAETRRAQITRQGDAVEAALDARFGDWMDVANVAPIALYLVSRECPVSGLCIKAGGTVMSRIFVAMSEGWSSGGRALTLDDVRAHFDEAMATDPNIIPSSTAEARQFVYDVAARIASSADSI